MPPCVVVFQISAVSIYGGGCAGFRTTQELLVSKSEVQWHLQDSATNFLVVYHPQEPGNHEEMLPLTHIPQSAWATRPSGLLSSSPAHLAIPSDALSSLCHSWQHLTTQLCPVLGASQQSPIVCGLTRKQLASLQILHWRSRGCARLDSSDLYGSMPFVSIKRTTRRRARKSN